MRITLLITACVLSLACNDTSSTASNGPKKPHNPGLPPGQSVGYVEDWQSATMGQEGHGGDALVCFKIPVTQALEKVGGTPTQPCPPNEPCEGDSNPGNGSGSSGVWRMTAAGRKAIASAKPLEQYLAEKIPGKKALLSEINQMSVEQGYEILMKPFLNLPGAAYRISAVHRQLGWLEEDGIASEYGLRDINDSGFINENEIDTVHCKELQAVVRRDNQLWYDIDIVKNFDNAGKVLIQMHEELYTWGKWLDRASGHMSFPFHETSEKTRRLILKVVDRDLSPTLLNSNLKALGFSIAHFSTNSNFPTNPGEYMTSEICIEEQIHVKETLQQALSLNDTNLWLKTAELFANRYLRDGHLEGLVEMRFNYPPVLAEMMAHTFNNQGGSYQFRRDVQAFLQKFARPESCHGPF